MCKIEKIGFRYAKWENFAHKDADVVVLVPPKFFYHNKWHISTSLVMLAISFSLVTVRAWMNC